MKEFIKEFPDDSRGISKKQSLIDPLKIPEEFPEAISGGFQTEIPEGILNGICSGSFNP